MTWITDNTGTRWVEPVPHKRRKSPRAIRFAELKVGDQIKRIWRTNGFREHESHYVVTDRWFDPVSGQRDAVGGEMVAVRRINERGDVVGRKMRHTLRGLASQGFNYAGDFIGFCKTRLGALEDGKVIGIGMRNSPKN
jgi:hypothetical protein